MMSLAGSSCGGNPGMIGQPVAAVVTDLDGALLDVRGRVPPNVAAAISQLIDAGIAVVPATARPPRSVRPVLPRATLAVCCNGALVLDLRHNVILAEATFDATPVLRVLSGVRDAVAGLGFGLRCGDVLVANEPYVRLRGGLPDNGRQVDQLRDSDVQRVHAIALRAAGWSASELAAVVAPALDGHGQISLSSSSVLDLVPPGASKVAGLEVVAAHQGWNRSAAVGLGDMPNDLDMLRWVAWSAAPHSAHTDVLAAVNYVIDEPVADEIAALLEELRPGSR